MSLQTGLVGRVETRVAEADTAARLGSGDVAVLATPRALALAEAATVAAVAARLPAGSTTVGVRVELDHHLPTPVGAEVTAEASLVAVEGRRLTFEVTVRECRDGVPVAVASGRVVRMVVDRDRFVAGLRNGVS